MDHPRRYRMSPAENRAYRTRALEIGRQMADDVARMGEDCRTMAAPPLMCLIQANVTMSAFDSQPMPRRSSNPLVLPAEPVFERSTQPSLSSLIAAARFLFLFHWDCMRNTPNDAITAT